MKRCALLAALLCSLPLFGQEEAVREDLRNWRYQFSLEGKESKDLIAIELSPAVFNVSQPELNDLRLIDGNGQSIPYALRVQQERRIRQERTEARTFGKQTLPDNSEQLSLDLGENPPEHNELMVEVNSTSYGRPLILEGSTDGKAWGTILDRVEVVRLNAGGQSINVTTFPYPASRQRYLRVTLKPDRLEKTTGVLTAASIFFSVDLRGLLREENARIEYRDPIRENYSDPASTWVLNLGGENVPVSRLTLDIQQPQFRRPFRLEEYEPGRPSRTVLSGTLKRDTGNQPLVLEFPEARSHRLRLTVVDSRNLPLNLRGVTYAGSSRLVVFKKPTSATMPLRLFSGNPSAIAPNYDFAATLPTDLGQPTIWKPGSEEVNPAYVPPPPPQLPFTEQYPYLLDGVLILALAILGYLLFLVARSAIQRHDSEVSQPAAP